MEKERVKGRVCILTLPLHTNYGGLLQAYALHHVIGAMGYEVCTDRGPSYLTIATPAMWGLGLQFMKRVVKRYLLRDVVDRLWPHYPTREEQIVYRRNTDLFVARELETVNMFEGGKVPNKDYLNSFDMYVVGSDQVWRPCYSPCLSNYFLDFTQGMDVGRVAYGASFGSAKWEYSDKEWADARRLLPRFDAVSVREQNGVAMCKERFGVDASWVLDPTLLLEVDDYLRLAERDGVKGDARGGLFHYIFDGNKKNRAVVNHVAKRLGLSPFCVEHRDGMVAPVGRWLEGFMDGEFVVTDSFHGVLFSLLFRRPFLAVSNRTTGSARLKSILGMLGLEQRLLQGEATRGYWEKVDRVVEEAIDFDRVWMRLDRKRSLDWLERALRLGMQRPHR